MWPDLVHKLAVWHIVGGTYSTMFLAGVYFPTEEMSHTLRVIGDYAPLGAALHAVRQSWMGQDPRPLYLGIMAVWAAAAGLAAARFFRWE